MMTENTYFKKLRRMKPRFKDMNIKRLRVFGSVARGEEKPDSDVDLLVDFIETPGLWGFLELKENLEKELGTNVDLVTLKSLKHPYVRKTVLEEARDV